jgi:uncharacterized membrane protein YtjA (UPF0391 family)
VVGLWRGGLECRGGKKAFCFFFQKRRPCLTLNAWGRAALGWHEGLMLPRGRLAMLRYALLFALISIVAGVLGFGGISAASAGIAKIFFFIAIAIFLLFVILAITGINLIS